MELWQSILPGGKTLKTSIVRLLTILPLAFVFIFLFSLASAQRHPPASAAAQRVRNEEQIRIAVFERLYSDYYAKRRHAPTVLFLGLGALWEVESGEARDPDRGIIDCLRTRLPLPIKPVSESTMVGEKHAVKDPSTGKAGAKLLVENVDWRAPTRPRVLAGYRLDECYSLETEYTLGRKGGSWTVVQARGLNQPPNGIACGRSGHHHYKIVVAYRPFRPRNHIIKNGGSDTTGGYTVDGGENARTSFGYLPSVEIGRFEVWVDGKRWSVPSRLWRDCVDPAEFRSADSKSALREPRPPREEGDWVGAERNVWLSSTGKRMTILISGGDGAGGYGAVLTLHRTGRCTRKLFGPP